MPTIKERIVDLFLLLAYSVGMSLTWVRELPFGNIITYMTSIAAFVLIVITIRLRLKESKKIDREERELEDKK